MTESYHDNDELVDPRAAVDDDGRDVSGDPSDDQPVADVATGPLASPPVIIGRNERDDPESADRGLLYLGRNITAGSGATTEDRAAVMLDFYHPHIGIVSGFRGSGKSTTLGTIVEGMAHSNLNVSAVVFDLMGVYRAMHEPNVSPRMVPLIQRHGFEPQGLSEVARYCLDGAEDDGAGRFSLTGSALSAEDWVTLLNVKPRSPSSDLIDDIVRRVRRGYATTEHRMVSGHSDFDIGDLTACLDTGLGVNDPARGYTAQTRRSVRQRLQSLDRLRLVQRAGTDIERFCRERGVYVLDISHPAIDFQKKALIVAIIVRSLLRHGVAPDDSIQRIPVWVLVDEAHLLVGPDNENAANRDLINYAKLGRRFGCGLVLGTQQLSAINPQILSQADFFITHCLTRKDDIVTLRRSVPVELPPEFAADNCRAIRRLDSGQALISSRCGSLDACLVEVRPTLCHFGGNTLQPEEVVPDHVVEQIDEPDDVEEPVVDVAPADIEADCQPPAELPDAAPEEPVDDDVCIGEDDSANQLARDSHETNSDDKGDEMQPHNNNTEIAPRRRSATSDRPWPVIRKRLSHGMQRLSRRMKVSLRTGFMLFLLGVGLPLAVMQLGSLLPRPNTVPAATAGVAAEEEPLPAADSADAVSTAVAEPATRKPARSTTVAPPAESPDHTAAYAQSGAERRARDAKSATSDEYQRRLETLRVLEGR